MQSRADRKIKAFVSDYLVSGCQGKVLPTVRAGLSTSVNVIKKIITRVPGSLPLP